MTSPCRNARKSASQSRPAPTGASSIHRKMMLRVARHCRPAFEFPVQKFLAVSLSAILALQPALALAGDAVPLRADPNAALANQPRIDAAVNGVPLVQIVTPNGAGLSHNKYLDFNVGTPGLILNNSNQEVSRSQIGGLIQGNANLATSGPAAVILNEVTGSSRSVLQGTLEVHGRAADVIIANQNGLTCNGCGFLNTPRVTLSTGNPVIGSDGSLSSLRVEGGDILIGVNGANATTVNVFDLMSRKISVNGTVAGSGDLNLIAGRNSIAYQTGVITPLGSDGKEPAIAIDSSALGGMYAGRIKLISTDKGAGVNMTGQMAANTSGMTLSADGRLMLGKAQAKTAIAARSASAKVHVASTLFSETAITLQGLTGVELSDNALVVSSGDVNLEGDTVALGANALVASGTSSDGSQTANGTLSVKAATLNVGNGMLAGGGLLSIAAGSVNLARGNYTAQDALRSAGDIFIAANGIAGTNAHVAAAGNLIVHSDGALTLDGGAYLADNNLLVEAASLTSSASLGALGTATVTTTAGGLTNTGAIASNGATAVSSAADLTNTGRIVSTGRVAVAAKGNLSNTATGLVAANGDVTVMAGALDNAGTIAGAQDSQGGGVLRVTTSGDLANSGTLLSLASTSITSLGNITNPGWIDAAGDLAIEANGTITVAGAGRIVAQDALTITGVNGGMMDRLTVNTGGLVNGAGSLALRSASLANAGEIGSLNGMFLAELAGNLTNTGVLYSGTTSTYRLDGAFTNTNADVIAGTDLTVAGLSGGRAAAITNTSGTIQSGSDMTLSASAITNRRAGGVTVTTDTDQQTTYFPTVQIVNRLTDTVTTTVTTTDEIATLNGAAGQLLAGRNLTIDSGAGGSVTNSYSQIAANADITIVAGSVSNDGRDLIQTIQTRTDHFYHHKVCHNVLGVGCAYTTDEYWSTTDNNTATSTIGAVYATIQAGGNLRADVSGYLTNNAVRGSAGRQVGLYSGAPLSGITLGPASSLSSIQTSATALLGRKAMFDQPANPNASYLIETRSAFIDPNLFLGSDYYLARIGYDPEHSLKRVGDAYVEYKLIAHQLFDLTGSNSLLAGDPVVKMRGLYDNAIDTQKNLGLTPGVALTPTQIAGLTKDIVWLEKQTINGQQVLVPRVYLAASTLANTSPASAQIKAGGVALVNAGGLTNSGAISAGSDLGIKTAGDLVNRGGSLFSASDIVVQVGSNFANQSGSVSGNNVTIIAGGNIANDTVVLRDAYANGFADRQQQLGAINAKDGLLVQAAGNIAAQGSQFTSGGDIKLVAGNDIELDPSSLSRARNDTFGIGYSRAASTINLSTQLNAGGDMTIVAGNDLLATAAQASAGGLLTVDAGRDISLAAGTDRAMSEQQLTHDSSGFLYSRTTTTYDYSNSSTSVASSFTGDDVRLSAGRDITLQGSSVTGQGDVALQAGGNVNLLSALDIGTQTHNSQTKTSGLMGAPGGGLGFAIGTRDVRDNATTSTATNIGSLVGSMEGDVSVAARGDFASRASVLVAPNGDLTVVASSVSIEAGIDTISSKANHDDHFSGLVVSGGGAPGSPLLSAELVASYVNAANLTQDGRARSLYQIAAAGEAINAATTLATQGVGSLLSVQATVGYGTQDIHWQSSEYAEQATNTLIIAGGRAALVATAGDIDLQGIGIAANDVRLSAAENVNLTSLALNHGYDASSSFSSAMVGVTVSGNLAGGVGIGVTAQASGAKSQGQERSTNYAPTIVSGVNSVTIVSGRDTNLKGAQVYGGKIDVTVGRDLTIVSDQDTQTKTASQSSWNAGGTLATNTAWVSAGYSNGSAEGDYKSVNNQSGLFAGDGGFNIDVGSVTTLTGAVIASTAAAEQNKLSTGALVTSDLLNASNWNASTSGGSVSIGSTGIPVPGMAPGQKNSGNDSSTAVAAIAPGQITITDPARQQALTGKSVAETIANLHTDTANSNRPVAALPDLAQTLQNQADRADAQAAATRSVQQVIGAPVAKLIGDAAKNGDISTTAQYIAHAALGCGLGAISGQCAAGAGGAVVGEAIAQTLVQNWVASQLQAIKDGTIDPVAFQKGMAEMQRQGADLAALGAGIAGALIGGSSGAGVGALTGENAARNNGVVLAPVIAGSVAADAIVAAGAACLASGVCIIGAGVAILAGGVWYIVKSDGEGSDKPDSDSKRWHNGPPEDQKIYDEPNKPQPPNPLDLQLVGAAAAALAKQIANGHAFDKHVIEQNEFDGSITTQQQFSDQIESILNNPSDAKKLSNGRSAYWDEASGVVVIRNPNTADGGTAFRPVDGKIYFDNLR